MGSISNSRLPDVATLAALMNAISLLAALADAETSSFTPTDSSCGLHLHTPDTAVNVTFPS